jgi:hypothetical protein
MLIQTYKLIVTQGGSLHVITTSYPSRRMMSFSIPQIMPLILRPATEKDAFRLGCIGRDAFRHHVSRDLFPPHLRSKSESGDPDFDEAEWRGMRTVRRMKEGKPAYVVVDVSEGGIPDEEGLVVGFCQWELPSEGQEKKQNFKDDANADRLPPILDSQAYHAMGEVIDRESHKILGPEGYSKMWCKYSRVRLNETLTV